MAIPVIAAATLFLCTPVAVWDGDGPIWCAEGPHVRVSGIAAREADGTCRTGHPCPDASADAARSALVALIGRDTGQRRRAGHVVVTGPTMRCRSVGAARGNRTGAWCTLADGRDLSCAMIATGTVVRWNRYWGNHRCRRQDG
jgi:endonuclease YncB( thermonuclease family)